MKIKEIIASLEEFAPLYLQENYDNSGLITGNADDDIKGVLCTVDVTEEVVEEAIEYGYNFILSHHPVIFNGIKSLTGHSNTERILIQAIKNDIAIYAAHTNIDNAIDGVNHIISNKLGLHDCKVLVPMKDQLYKIVTFVPADHAAKVREALFKGGAGHIGNYDNCSYNVSGQGTFRGNEISKPFVGEKGSLHVENETRIEVVVVKHHIEGVIKELLMVHPYEEVVYDIYPLMNNYEMAGSGMIGYLEKTQTTGEFLENLKNIFKLTVIRYSGNENKKLEKIAVCGGAGSFLIYAAIFEKADAFVTSDIKYHQFFDAINSLLLCDIGHYESEQFTKELFYSFLTKKFSTFAVRLSNVVTNPLKYHI
jgi:dinuclear metal center YbgI/SA1388 family protein